MKLKNILIVVKDLEKAKTFYHDLFGLDVILDQDGNVIFESDIVSGLASDPERKTPPGIFTLYYKKSPDVLRGTKKADGTYSYEQPVTYWMPFNGGIGLHDANWRGKFGGEIYTDSGSHGCVNLPPSKAGELYEYVEAGMPIVCYWRDEVTFVNK